MIFCLFLPPVVSPDHIPPALSRMNELVQAGIIHESHCHLQEVCLFSSQSSGKLLRPTARYAKFT